MKVSSPATDFFSKYGTKKNKFQFKFIKNRYFQSFIPWVVPITIIILWQFLSSIGVIPTRILPAPLAVVTAAIKLTQSGELPRNIGIISLRSRCRHAEISLCPYPRNGDVELRWTEYR